MKEEIDKNKQPFLYVIENIEKVSIDEKLKPIFIEVLKMMQKYFDENNLISARNYGDFFDKFLIGDGKDEIKLVPNAKGRPIACFNRTTNNIEVTDYGKTINASDARIIMHEFIHYLVHRQPIKGEKNIGTFLDEGFTENLTQNIMGKKNQGTYDYNVEIVDLIKKMNGSRESYITFLQGHNICQNLLNDCKNVEKDFFIVHTLIHNPELIIKDNEERDMLIAQYKLKSQRGLIESLSVKQCTNIEDFAQIVKALSTRPFRDLEFMMQFYKKYEMELIKAYKERKEITPVEEENILGKLEELIHAIEKYDRYECEDICRLTLGDKDNSVDIYINENGDILKKSQFDVEGQTVYGGYNAYTNDYNYFFQNEKGKGKISLNPDEFKKLDFSEAKKDYQVEINGLMEFFSQIELPQKQTIELSNNQSLMFGSSEQIQLSVAKNDIEKLMQNGQISEILEIKDERMLEYFSQQNILKQYSNNTSRPKVYLISRQDEAGNEHYEFIARNNNSYMKLSEIEQVSIQEKNIAVEKTTIPGQAIPMSPVDCKFSDKAGRQYFVYHFRERTMQLAYSDSNDQNELKKKITTDDYGLNNLLHKNRFNELLMAGYHDLDIGVEKVKEVYRKYHSNAKENEVENARDDDK